MSEGGEESSGQDKAEKSYHNILEEELQKGLKELNRPGSGLLLSGLSAGLDIGFGPLLMAMLLSASWGDTPVAFQSLIVGSAYSVGFIFVVIGRSNLFTEHTTLAIIPVLDGQASVRELGRVWGLVYVSNIVGTTIFAGFAVLLGPTFDVVEPGVFAELARPLLGFSWWATLLAATFAGWLMGLLTWLVSGSRDTIGGIVVIWLVTLVIGVGHMPHSIAGTVEVLMGVIASDQISLAEFWRFLALSTVGNIIGGTLFVGLLKWGQVVSPEPRFTAEVGESSERSASGQRRRSEREGEP